MAAVRRLSARPVLLVEDNDETRAVLERILAIRGYHYRSAEDARAALAYLEQGGSPAVIILDLHLPGMDGRELLLALRNNPEWAEIPVVVYSGDAGTVPDVAARIRKGTDDPDVLLAAIEACVTTAATSH